MSLENVTFSGIYPEIGRSEKMQLMIRDTGVMGLSAQGDRHHQKGHGPELQRKSLAFHHTLP